MRSIGCGANSTHEERQTEIRKFVDDALKWAVVYVTTKMSGTCHDIAAKWSDTVMELRQV